MEALSDIEASAGSNMPYLGYTELRLDIPEVVKFDHDVLMMVYPDSKYSHRVPVIIGALHIDEALDLATYNDAKCFLPVSLLLRFLVAACIYCPKGALLFGEYL